MRLLIISISFLLFITACKEKSDPATIVEESKLVQLPIEELLKNPAIEIGPAITRNYQDKIHCTGRISIPPTDILAIHSKVPGSIQYIKFLPGDYVKKGALLFQIEDPSLIEKQRIYLETLEKFNLAQKEYDRKNELFQTAAINQKEYEMAESDKNLLESSYKGLETELETIGIDTKGLVQNRLFQTKVSIYSKLSGYVQEVYVNNGQMILPETRLMDIANDQHVHLELDVLAKDVPLVEKGQKVTFTLPKKSMDLRAEIVKLNPLLDESQGTRGVHCDIQEDDCQFVLPGMFVNARIQVEDREVTGLPTEAVVKEGQEYYVFRKNGRELIREQIKFVEVKEDFIIFEANPQDSFVTRGAYYIE